MNDLVSRQRAIDKINERQRKLIYCFGFENDMVKTMDIAKSIITAIPSVQPDVIRCKDCKHYSKYKEDYMCGLNVLAYVCETDFCSRAERREDGQTDFTASGD